VPFKRLLGTRFVVNSAPDLTADAKVGQFHPAAQMDADDAAAWYAEEAFVPQFGSWMSWIA